MSSVAVSVRFMVLSGVVIIILGWRVRLLFCGCQVRKVKCLGIPIKVRASGLRSGSVKGSGLKVCYEKWSGSKVRSGI